MVLIEYVPFGDLLGYLRKSRGLKDTYYKDPDVKPQTNLTSQRLMKFAWQIADGMSYLSSKSVILTVLLTLVFLGPGTLIILTSSSKFYLKSVNGDICASLQMHPIKIKYLGFSRVGSF